MVVSTEPNKSSDVMVKIESEESNEIGTAQKNAITNTCERNEQSEKRREDRRRTLSRISEFSLSCGTPLLAPARGG